MKNSNYNSVKSIFVILLCLTLASCSSYRPIFSPNHKFNSVGAEVANQDADKCMKEADEYLKASKKRRALKEGGRGAGIGAIFGAIFGLFTGNINGVVKSAVIGAGIGGVAKGGSVLAEDKLTPDAIKQRYVSACLGQKDYQILGWE